LVIELGNNATVTEAYQLDVDNTVGFFDAAYCSVACTAGTWGQVTSGAASLGTITTPVGTTIYTEAADFTAVPISIPEPMTLGLFGTGLAALFMLRRRIGKNTTAA
jgi:hypothetical protein